MQVSVGIKGSLKMTEEAGVHRQRKRDTLEEIEPNNNETRGS